MQEYKLILRGKCTWQPRPAGVHGLCPSWKSFLSPFLHNQGPEILKRYQMTTCAGGTLCDFLQWFNPCPKRTATLEGFGPAVHLLLS